MVSKTHLIVSGVARSGTTALAELLNAHPAICVGIERFKFRYLRDHDYSVELFDRARFFDFREGDTNLLPDLRPAWKPVYDAIDAKWDEAQVVGDKVPDLTPVLADLMTAQPGTRCIYILRNLKDVGLSWQARANRTRDAWPSGKGFIAACEAWSDQQAQLRALLDNRPDLAERLLLIDYDRLNDPEVRTGEAILNFLGVTPAPAFQEMLAHHRAFLDGREARKVPKKFVGAYKAVDMGVARGLRRESRQSVARWVDASPAAALG